MKLQKQNIGVWVKASELKEINYPICIRYDGGGVYWYGTVCSHEELDKHISEQNPIDEIEWLKPIEQAYVLTEDEMKYDLMQYKQFLSMNGFFNELANDFVEQGLKKCTEQFIQSITQ